MVFITWWSYEFTAVSQSVPFVRYFSQYWLIIFFWIIFNWWFLCIFEWFRIAVESIFSYFGWLWVHLWRQRLGEFHSLLSRLNFWIASPVSNGDLGNRIYCADKRTSSAQNSCVIFIAIFIDSPIPKDWPMLWYAFPVDNRHNATPTRFFYRNSTAKICVTLFQPTPYKFNQFFKRFWSHTEMPFPWSVLLTLLIWFIMSVTQN